MCDLQIPLLRLAKEGPNSPYYSGAQVKLGVQHQSRAPHLLQVHSWQGASKTASQQQPESVRLPLLSMNSLQKEAVDKGGVACDEYELAKIRQEDTRWNQPAVPLLKLGQRHYSEVQSQHHDHPSLQPKSVEPQNTRKEGVFHKSTALSLGPALLSEYEEANRQKEELITRMISAMRTAGRKPTQQGKPIEPKYSLLRLEPAKEAPQAKIERPKQPLEGGYRVRNEPRLSRSKHRYSIKCSSVVVHYSVW